MSHHDEGTESHHHRHGPGEASHQHDHRPPGGACPQSDLARGEGAGRILFLDAFSGVSGDMLVAALLDLGTPLAAIEEPLASLPLSGYRIETGTVARSGIAARRFAVAVDEPQPERSFREIRSMLQEAELPAGCRAQALRSFELLARAEARAHGVPIEEVHFHEVGAVDSIVDAVAACAALDWLGAEVVASPLPMGRGMVRCRHGVLPLPAPATVAVLEGAPTYDGEIDAELVTPTGASLVMATATRFCRWPAMRPRRSGWGAGSRELPDRPNLLRVVLGDYLLDAERGARERGWEAETGLAQLECNIDDQSAELVAHAVERLMEEGALDAWTTPIGMKRGRPAVMLSALASPEICDRLARVVFAETTSLGLRRFPVRRRERPRRIVEVATRFGSIPVKVAGGDGVAPNVAPEFEACRRAAVASGAAVKEVYAAALAAALEAGLATEVA